VPEIDDRHALAEFEAEQVARIRQRIEGDFRAATSPA
jgi:hypothetical protein